MVIAPWMAEMSWGGIPFTDALLVVVFLGPMYGGAALLTREFVRRTRRGWPAILLLAAAFGVFQAGVVDQSLFNPSYGRYDFQHPVHIDGIDISLYYLVNFVAGHVVVSITLPITLAEAWSRRPSSPWLSRAGLWMVGVLYVLSTLVNHFGVKDEDGHGFQASPIQVATALLVVALLVAAAMVRGTKPATIALNVPPSWSLALLGFVAYLLYLPGESGWALAVAVVVITATCVVVSRWSHVEDWSTSHVFWLAIGATLTGVAVPYLADPYDISVSTAQELLDDTVAAAICLIGVVLTVVRRKQKTRVATSGP